MKKTAPRRPGQSSTEYIILVVLVSLAVLLGVEAFGATLWDETTGSAYAVDQELRIEQ